MNKKELLEKIMQKKEFSGLPIKDVKSVFKKFDNENYLDEEKVKLTRNELRNIFSSFTSRKILSLKNKDEEWILRKHVSTRERLPYYEEVYKRILKSYPKEFIIIDLGSGINGFSYKYFKKLNKNPEYLGVEAIKQLVDITNLYFRDKNISGHTEHLSLLDMKKLKEITTKTKNPRIVFLFKVIDSLETLERNYSKELINEMANISNEVVLSFATRSMGGRKKFRVDRTWVLSFINDNFKVLDDFEIGNERYICFSKNNS